MTLFIITRDYFQVLFFFFQFLILLLVLNETAEL